MNSDLSDIGSALTASLARDGQGGMTAVLPMASAGFTYTNDTNTGIYRISADTQAIKCGGSDVVTVNTSGIDVAGSITQNGASLQPVGTDYQAGWRFAASCIEDGDVSRAFEANKAFGPVAEFIGVGPLNWVAIGLRSALSVHFQASDQRNGRMAN